MQINPKIYKTWVSELEMSLPKLNKIFSESKIEILIIGASVLEFYAMSGWIPPLSRQTRDLDLSVGIVSPEGAEYNELRNAFLNADYTEDATMKYRYFPRKKKVPARGYVDLLAFPASANVTDKNVLAVMNVGEGFSLRGFNFADKEKLMATKKVAFPNPIGLVYLKSIAYLDEPIHRIKDLADIIELIIGLVRKGTHYDLESFWVNMKIEKESDEIRLLLKCLGDETSTTWDIENAKQELSHRGLWSNDLPKRLKRALEEIQEILS